MAKNIYSSKAIMKDFGLSKSQYRSQYEVFRRRVENLNRLTGANYSPIKEFRYSLLNKESSTIKSIEKISSAPRSTSFRSQEIAKDFALRRYSGLIERNPALKRLSEKIGEKIGEKTYTPADFDRDARKIADNLKKSRERDALIGSEEITLTSVPESLTNANREFITNQDLQSDILYD